MTFTINQPLWFLKNNSSGEKNILIPAEFNYYTKTRAYIYVLGDQGQRISKLVKEKNLRVRGKKH